MMTSGAASGDVLVVGAGPAGLTAALALRRRGVRVRIVDAAPHGASTSRAAVIHARTLEVLDDLGVADRIVAEGVVVPDFTVRDRGRTIAHLDFRGLPTPYPFTLMLPQARTEQLLGEALAATGCEVEREVELVALRSEGGRDVARLRRGDGTFDKVVPRFVVGADGSRSRVRQERGIAFDGAEYDASFVLADVTLEWALPPDEVQLFLAEQGLVVVAPLPGGRHRIVATMDDAPTRPSVDDVQRLLDERGPGGAVLRSVVWSSRFRVAHRLASRFRDGGVFLVGDAAHVHSPAGGQGMNLGIQDAAMLGGLIGEVISGARGADASDAYERERRAAARGVIALTDRMTRMATLRRPALRSVRNAAMGVVLGREGVRRALATRIAQLDG